MGALALSLALVLAGSALHKALSRERLTLAAARLAGTGPASGALLLAAAGSVEMLAALALALPGPTRLGAILAAAVWLVYAAALFARRGQVLDCGCDLFAREKPVSAFQVGRALMLAALATLVGVLPAAPLTIDAPFAALALVALYIAAGELAAIPSPHRR
ncbi:MAG: hypothetical protein KGL48_07745 [Sphingomonadales bacterium]|nr:hypothetical protein [Sphingomonadales bacterium]MDE2568815.1 hypothetical protein [Sphingomonadales bacterium]